MRNLLMQDIQVELPSQNPDDLEALGQALWNLREQIKGCHKHAFDGVRYAHRLGIQDDIEIIGQMESQLKSMIDIMNRSDVQKYTGTPNDEIPF